MKTQNNFNLDILEDLPARPTIDQILKKQITQTIMLAGDCRTASRNWVWKRNEIMRIVSKKHRSLPFQRCYFWTGAPGVWQHTRIWRRNEKQGTPRTGRNICSFVFLLKIKSIQLFHESYNHLHTYTITHPRTVMVEPFYTVVTDWAVTCPGGSEDLAGEAVFQLHWLALHLGQNIKDIPLWLPRPLVPALLLSWEVVCKLPLPHYWAALFLSLYSLPQHSLPCMKDSILKQQLR